MPLPPLDPSLVTRLATPRWWHHWPDTAPTPHECALSLWECLALMGRQATYLRGQGPLLVATPARGTVGPLPLQILAESLGARWVRRHRRFLIATWTQWAAQGLASGDWGRLVFEVERGVLVVVPPPRSQP